MHNYLKTTVLLGLCIIIPYLKVQSQKLVIPKFKGEISMKYYYVEEFINNSQHEINFNPTEEIVENYSECNMISLNRKPRKYWPKEIKAKPEIVLTIRTMLVEKGEYSNCPELIITEHDFNGTMMWKTIVTAGKYNKRKSKCIKNLIKKFHERIKNSTIGVCSNKRIICEVCEQKKTDSKD